MSLGKKTKNKKKINFKDIFKKISFWVLFISFWVLFFWTIFFSSVMKIDRVRIVGDVKNASQIQSFAKDIMNQKYFNKVPKNNLLIFPVKVFQEKLLKEFNIIRTIDVKREFPKEIVIDIEERKDFIIWCSDKNCWLVDERSEAFHEIEKEQIDQFEDRVVVLDGSEKSVEKYGKVVSPRIVKILLKLADDFSSLANIEIDKKSFFTPSSMSGELQFKTKTGWKIYFSTDRPISVQIKVLKKMLDIKLRDEDLGKLEYIDLRIKGKVVYRFRDYKEREDDIEVKGVSKKGEINDKKKKRKKIK